MDGDSTAKSFEQGANSGLKDQELTGGIHESVNQTVRIPSSTVVAHEHIADKY